MKIALKRPLKSTSIGLIALVLLVDSFIYMMPAQAVSNVGPDPADDTSSNGIRYVVSNTPFVDIKRTYVKIFYNDNTNHAITIEGANLCNDGHDEGASLMSNGANHTLFTAYRVRTDGSQGPEIDRVWGTVDRSGSCDSKTLNIPTGGLTELNDYTEPTYAVIVRAEISSSGTSNTQNSFRYRTSNKGIVGLSAAGAQDTGFQMVGSDTPSGRANIYIPQAVACNIDAPVWRDINIYDPDNGVRGIQDWRFYVKIWKAGSGYLGNDDMQAINKSYWSAGERWSGNAAAGFIPGSRSDDTYTLRVRWEPNAKYRIHVFNVMGNNTLQFGLPWDSAPFELRCNQDPDSDPNPDPGGNNTVSLTPSTDITPKSVAESGATVTATARLDSNALNSSLRGTADWNWRVWLDNGDRSFGSGDNTLTNRTPASTPSRFNDRQVPRAGVQESDTFAINTDYSYVCSEVYGVTGVNTAEVTTNIVGNGAGPICVPIGKYPSLEVSGGDLRTGGVFADIGSTCSIVSGDEMRSYGVYGHNYATPDKGSLGEYGVISAGPITDFGSDGFAPIIPESRALRFANKEHANNSDLDGYFYGGNGVADGQSIQTHCMPNAFRAYPATGGPVPSISNGGAASIDTSTIANSSQDVISRRFSGSNARLDVLTSDLTIERGERRILRVTSAGGTGNRITIFRNISYEDVNYSSVDQLPLFALIVDANIDIQVAPGVTRLDGLYVTRGNFVTCSPSGEGIRGSFNNTRITWNDCNRKLEVNGSVITGGQVFPYRTAGQVTVNDNEPAELFNLRPDLILNSYAEQMKITNLTTINQAELPPRF